MKTKLLSLFFALICASPIFASDIQVDGIWYDFDSYTKTASVTYRGSYCYDYDNEYTGSVVIPETVTYNSITYSVTTIGDDAFSSCSGLTSITIPNSVTTIGDYAFSSCSGLTSITIPNSVTTIGFMAFYRCSGLTSVTIGNSVTTIGNSAFSDCSSLTSVTINSNSIIKIDYSYSNIERIFGKQVKEYIIGDSVTTIGDHAFYGCSGLTSVTIGNSVTTIGGHAFYGCSGLTSVTIPNSVTTIGDRAFYGCSGLTSVTIPNSVTTIGDYAFCECSGLTSVIIGNSVTTIGGWAFYGCSGLTSVTIPNSVTTIGDGAFSGCSGLTSVTIPNSVTLIGNSAFYKCSGLTSITIPNSVTTIEFGAFRDCSGLTSVTIPNSVTTIGDYAFWNVNNIVYNGTATGSPWGAKCVNGYVDGYLVYSDATKTTLCGCSSAAIGKIVIPNSVITIGDYAFYNCSGLNSITIPNSVTTIGNYAFYDCTGLTSVTIGNSVTTIGYGAFQDCSGLTSVTIPNSVTTIRYGAFENVLNINYTGTATGAPWGAKCINGYFDGCLIYSDATKTNLCACLPTAIGNIQLPNSVTTIGDYAFNGCSNLTSVTIPNSVTTIGDHAFNGCSSLTSVTIPNSVITIGDYAFNECNIQSITIPENVTSIGLRAFYQCNNLTTVYWNAKNCTIPDSYGIFDGIQENITTFILGNKVEVIPDRLCSGMSKVKEMIVPFSVTTIGDRAFGSVSTITIPNWINSLDNEWLGWHPGKEKTVYVAISPFEYNNNPESLDAINPIIKNASYQATLIPQCANVATYNASPTTIEMDIDLTNIPTTALYDSISIDYFGEENDIENILAPSTQNHVIFTGLTPNQKANIYYTSKKIGENDWKEGAKLEIQLPKLNLTTLTPKVVSAGTAVVAAETNISDYETNVGFEWRKYDAPETMPSKSGAAIICNGMMEGRLLNLGTNAYWNVRPYYEAADGTRYYGEWITFDPSDFSYFEPTVHTYALAMSPTANNIQVRGYVMTGTDDVTEQGFEYWFKGGQKAPHRALTATPDSIYRVTASGQVMSAVLEDLAYGSTYTCRAYAIAGGKTYYGEEVQFLTPEDPRPIYTLTVLAGENGSVNAEVSGQYREGEQVTLTATPNVGYLFEQWSDGNTENPYILTIMQDTEITATFKQAESGLTNLHSDIRATKYFHNGNLIIEWNGIKYTATSQKVL